MISNLYIYRTQVGINPQDLYPLECDRRHYHSCCIVFTTINLMQNRIFPVFQYLNFDTVIIKSICCELYYILDLQLRQTFLYSDKARGDPLERPE